MKIGILTFHRAHNYGAVLQCYALQEVLKGMGHEVEVIDYRQPAIDRAYNSWQPRWFIKKIVKIWKMYDYLHLLYEEGKRRHKFGGFLKNYLNVQHPCTSINIPNNYDYYVIGSDQLFNLEITNGLDPVYSGESINGNGPKLIGYAISSNQESIRKIGQDNWNSIFNNFTSISFREKALADLLYKLYGKEVDVCFDPTLLTDINIWNNIKINKDIEKDCIVLYQVRWNEGEEDTLEKKAYQLAKQMNYKVINLSNRDYGVEEWVLYIKYAKCVITSSFHASVFALIFNRPLYSYVLNDGRDSRYVDLLNSVGASDCLKDLHDSISELPEMDFDTINKKLQYLRQDSLTYLNEQIK